MQRDPRRVLALCAFGSCLLAMPALGRVRAVIVQWGEIEAGGEAGPLGPEYEEHSLGTGHQVTSQRFVNDADTIPAQLCRTFGFLAWLAGDGHDVVPDRVLLRVTHPVLTRPDGVSSTQDTLMLPVRNGVTGTSFGFDEAWEAQPGTWVFDLVLDASVAASKTFDVVEPAAGTSRPACPASGVS